LQLQSGHRDNLLSQEITAMQSITPGWRVQIITGAALALMALVAVRVDVLNNLEYGLTVSTELATILVLAAAGVVAIPAAASVVGWSRHLRATLSVCVVLTVWSAISSYSAKQSTAILKAQSAGERYQSAKMDEKAARDTLNRIKETGDAGELGRLQSLASMAREKACRKPRSEDCKLAEADEKAATNRLSEAKARDKAQATLAKAKEEAKGGPAEASMIASVIAPSLGLDASEVARGIALALTALGIAATQLVALLGGHAANLIGSGLRARPQPRTALPAPRPAEAVRAGVAPVQGGNVISLDIVRHSLRAWLDEATVPGGEMRGGEALKAYKRCAGRVAKDMKASEFRQLLTALLGPGAVEKRTSGFIVRGLQLRAAETREAAK
jgi:hypothetical protein